MIVCHTEIISVSAYYIDFLYILLQWMQLFGEKVKRKQQHESRKERNIEEEEEKNRSTDHISLYKY